MTTAATSQIQLVDIDKELKRLWDEELGKDKIRACLFNLIIYSQKAERAGFCQEIIKSVIGKFPCRIILITVEENAKEEYLRTSVSTETIQAGEAQIFCEKIQIDVAGSPLERVPFIVLPQILPDLPVYLLWTQDPATENAVLPHLSNFARRIIFDSEATHNLQLFGQSLLNLQKTLSLEIGDLNWSALRGWRHLFATTFNTEEEIACLNTSKFIRIYYNACCTTFHHRPEVEAAYFQAWLAAQLEWKFQNIDYEEGNIRLTYRHLNHEVVIFLVRQEEPSLPSGALLQIEIESQQNKAHYVFKRHPQTRQVFIQYSDLDHCELPHATFLEGVSAGQEILDEIFNSSDSTHYKSMLSVLAQIPWRHVS